MDDDDRQNSQAQINDSEEQGAQKINLIRIGKAEQKGNKGKMQSILQQPSKVIHSTLSKPLSQQNIQSIEQLQPTRQLIFQKEINIDESDGQKNKVPRSIQQIVQSNIAVSDIDGADQVRNMLYQKNKEDRVPTEANALVENKEVENHL